jgi:hypothetical protein
MEGPGTNSSDSLLLIYNSWKTQEIEARGGIEVTLEKEFF